MTEGLKFIKVDFFKTERQKVLKLMYNLGVIRISTRKSDLRTELNLRNKIFKSIKNSKQINDKGLGITARENEKKLEGDREETRGTEKGENMGSVSFHFTLQ